MRSWIAACILIVLGACNGSGESGPSCPVTFAAGGNNFSEPSYQYTQSNCTCSQTRLDGSASGGSCNSPQDCPAYCCTCPNGTGWMFNARVCSNHACLDESACQAVLAASPDPCKAPLPK